MRLWVWMKVYVCGWVSLFVCVCTCLQVSLWALPRRKSVVILIVNPNAERFVVVRDSLCWQIVCECVGVGEKGRGGRGGGGGVSLQLCVFVLKHVHVRVWRCGDVVVRVYAQSRVRECLRACMCFRLWHPFRAAGV